MVREFISDEGAASAGSPDAAQQPFDVALRGSPITVFHQNRNLAYTWINNPAMGYQPEEVIGKTDAQLFTPDAAAVLTAIKRRVLTTGEGVRQEVRANIDGCVRYYDLTVEPLHDRRHHITGLTGAAIDITCRREEENRQRFRARLTDAFHDLDDPRDVMRIVAAEVGRHFQVARVNYGEMTPDDQTFTVESEYFHGVDTIAGRYPLDKLGPHIAHCLRQGETVVVDDVTEQSFIDPDTAHWLMSLGMRTLVAVPIMHRGKLMAWLGVKDDVSRVWRPDDVKLIEEIAQRTRQAVERARAERALRDSEARHRLISQLTSDYAFSYRVQKDGHHTVEWKSGAFERITGYRNDEILSTEDWHKLFHHDDLPRLHRFTEQLLANRPQTIEVRIITRAGETRWLNIDALPVKDDQTHEVVRVVGAARDITERKQIEAERSELLQRLEAERALFEQIIDQMPVGVIILKAPSGKTLFINAQVQSLTGYSPQEDVDPLDRTDFQALRPDGTPYSPQDWPLARALRDGQAVASEEIRFRHSQHGTWRTLRGNAAPVRDAAGRMVAVVSTFYDVTEEKQAEQAIKFLARTGRIMASSLDYQATLRKVVALSVPDLADWCQVDMVTPTGDRQFLAGAHADPQRTKFMTDLQTRFPVAPNASWGPWAVLRSGESECVSEIHDDMLVEIARDEEHLRHLREAGLQSYMCLPLKARDRVAGVLTFVTDRTSMDRRYDEADLSLAEELARRASTVIEKSLLFAEVQHELGERRQAERKLQAFNETLEQRVAERTAEAEQRAEQLRALAAELTQAEQRERRRLAQTLHDHLQQLLVAAKLRLHATLGHFTDESLRQAFHQIDDLLTQSVDASRSLTIELSPPILHDAGLPAALDWLGRWMGDKHRLHVTVHADPAANPDSDVRVFLFNAVRELLFNIVKHAQTLEATVELALSDEQTLRLVVSDQGVGFDTAKPKDDQPGFGLFSIQQRLDIFGGHLHIESGRDKGTRIELFAPCKTPS
ncbi:MAG: PAS domain S-box protein [Phycisphaeraceae bacterium]